MAVDFDPPFDHDEVIAALIERGYTHAPAKRFHDYDEMISPSAHNTSAVALMAGAHSILVSDTIVRILRAGASFQYALPLPPRTLDMLKPEPEPESPPPSIWTDAIVERLGVDSDAAIARDMGVSPERVRHQRQNRNIAPASRPLLLWTEAVIRRLGIDSDAQIARDIGVPREWVRHQRLGRKIPPAPRPSRREAATA